MHIKIAAALLSITGIAAADPLGPVELVADPGCNGTCTTLQSARAGNLRVEVRKRVTKPKAPSYFFVAFSDGKQTWITQQMTDVDNDCATGKCWNDHITGSAIVTAHDVVWIRVDYEHQASSSDPHNPHPWSESEVGTLVIGCTTARAVPACATAFPDRVEHGDTVSHATITDHTVTFKYDSGKVETVDFAF